MNAAIRENVPMSELTSWRVGGCARRLVEPEDRSALVGVLRSLDPSEPVIYVGLGSNLLVRDGGIRGTVVLLRKGFSKMVRLDDRTLRIEAGVACAQMARRALQWKLSGADFFAGIPGTLGGALAMNAGAFGDETWRHVKAIEWISRSGDIEWVQAEKFTVSYRQVTVPPGQGFLSADLVFEPDPAVTRKGIRELLARRAATQPLEHPNSGSVFMNPPGDHAARLIESCGLKGWRIGDAEVSVKHANFIVNRGQARARDIEALICHVHDTVQAKTGIDLTTEVRIIGEPGHDA
ncbi:MAG: UDP-N-acetylmuramate dehydrogenase [Gammaproteobacteria bacterium]